MKSLADTENSVIRSLIGYVVAPMMILLVKSGDTLRFATGVIEVHGRRLRWTAGHDFVDCATGRRVLLMGIAHNEVEN